MSKHKNQHIVPACYLDQFLSRYAPDKHKGNPNFKLGVWVNNIYLSDNWEMKHPRNNFFTESYFYDLSASNHTDKKEVEKYLGFVEGKFSRSLKNIERSIYNNNIIDKVDYANISVFYQHHMQDLNSFKML